MLPGHFEFSLPTKLIYGIGALGGMRQALSRFGKREALLVTDRTLCDAGTVNRVEKGFKGSGITITGIFDQVPSDATLPVAEKCAQAGSAHACDMIVAVGGGGVIDTAKAANLAMKKGALPQHHKGEPLLETHERLLPSIVIPTTAGAGSQINRVAVVSDTENDEALFFCEDQFLPQLAVLDPEITLPTPKKLTAYSGLNALVLAVEAYLDNGRSPASDAMALHAIKLISDNMLRVNARPDDTKSRGAMLVGSVLAGSAFSHATMGMAQAVSHALKAVYHIPPGLSGGLLLPGVMAYQLEEKAERLSEIAAAMGIVFPQVVTESRSLIKSASLDLIAKLVNRPELQAFRGFMGEGSHKARELAVKTLDNFEFVDQWIRKQAAHAGIEHLNILNRQLAYLTKMPLNLQDAGIDDDLAKLDRVVLTVMQNHSTLWNPADFDRGAVIKMIKKAFSSEADPVAVLHEDLKIKSRQ